MTTPRSNVEIDKMSNTDLVQLERTLALDYARHQAANLSLDLTRGKPSAAQLDLSDALDGILQGNYIAPDGTDTRGYGGLDGLPHAKELGAKLLGIAPEDVLVGGNSSLMLMYIYVMTAHQFGLEGTDSAWSKDPAGAKFLCPVPGYDRHFLICEELGITMISVPMTGHGPDMDIVEGLIKSDPAIKGMWCVPRYSNPTGETYSDEVVKRIAALGKMASPQFRVMWDNAYAAHTLGDNIEKLLCIKSECQAQGTQDSVMQFASTSKITFSGAGLAFAAGSQQNLSALKKRLQVMTIGPDKVNQLRHIKLLGKPGAIENLMGRQAAVIAPKFACVERHLKTALNGKGVGTWSTPQGGYFVSFDARPGLAKTIVKLAGDAGVKLTPAGAAYPYGKDPEDCNIRLAPTHPLLEDVEAAMAVFTTCVELASVRQRLAQSPA